MIRADAETAAEGTVGRDDAPSRPTVLLITGSGRSGSTLLGNLLGNVDGFVSVGELRYLWERGLVENRLCGCGEHVRDCPFWTEVLHRAFGDRVDDAHAASLQHDLTRMRHMPQLLSARRSGHVAAPLAEQRQRLARVYDAITAVTGCRVIVDSSKLPAHGLLVDGIESVDLRVLHLVRDARASAHSWARQKAQPDRGTPGWMQQQPPLKAATLWNVWNGITDAVWSSHPDRYLRMRYETLVADPDRQLTRVLEWMGIDAASHVGADRVVDLDLHHTVAGNPMRLERGPVAVRVDDEWRASMRRPARALVTAATFPLLRRYGYPLRSGMRDKSA